MSSTRRMVPLLRRAQDKQDAVARQLAERQKALDTHAQRLEDLRQYADDYLNNPLPATSVSQLLNRRAFLDRLDTAVKLQAQTVERNQLHVDAERKRLLAASRERKVLEQLQQRYQAQEQHQADRRDQRVLDDLGARISRNRPNTPESPT
ncbi:flagellar export protein FliJ [Stenotrophomonas ginsengisoli]|uniref:Flagellar FliJ protein n=1 Tax=Stenotrophomonas ginsengisoli TaxID=336566 RepID=A0A0R0DJK8_9GAMM|nr:flagellar export protein FliJ [Stenotrophomonas ginsengisoli]KRG78930.1 flagellar export protein FliJ [Stenotrophomonas ginsengisoli]